MLARAQANGARARSEMAITADTEDTGIGSDRCGLPILQVAAEGVAAPSTFR
jgi:hypothetical protein